MQWSVIIFCSIIINLVQCLKMSRFRQMYRLQTGAAEVLQTLRTMCLQSLSRSSRECPACYQPVPNITPCLTHQLSAQQCRTWDRRSSAARTPQREQPRNPRRAAVNPRNIIGDIWGYQNSQKASSSIIVLFKFSNNTCSNERQNLEVSAPKI